jgi:hypothetical protein
MIVHSIVKDDTVLFCDSNDNVVDDVLRFATPHRDPVGTEPWYTDFCYDLMKSNLVPIFEWNPSGKLMLFAIRTTNTYEYLTPDKIQALAVPYYIPIGV